MRKAGLAVGVCVGLLLVYFLFFDGIIADGAYTLSVTVVSESGSPIARLRCEAADLDVEGVRQLEKQESTWEWQRSNPLAVFSGQPLFVRVPFSTHHKGWWWGRSHHQHRYLLVELEDKNGKQTLTVVELPDCSKVKAIQVIVP